MSKAEEFIERYTRNCSNDIIGWHKNGLPIYTPWLTPDQARKAVEIAREEVMDEIENVLLSEVLPCFMHGGDAGDLVAMLDEKLNKKQ